eukprot:4987340-Lingulodinium_polyedra.AAC.1
MLRAMRRLDGELARLAQASASGPLSDTDDWARRVTFAFAWVANSRRALKATQPQLRRALC